jgi:transposase
MLINRGTDGRFHHDNKQFPYVVSLDCHDKATFTKIVNVNTEQIIFNHNILGSLANVIRIMESCHVPKNKTLILYEAGSLGFYPYRCFTKAGYACLVINPNSIPNNNMRRKTNKKDAGANLNYHLSGILSYVTVPTERDEAARDLQRHRESIVEQHTKQRQRINTFTKRKGFIFELTKSNWSKAHEKWLQTIALDPIDRSLLDCMLDELNTIESHIKKIEKLITTTVDSNKEYAFLTAAYALLPGFGRVTAKTVVLECPDYGRFVRPNAVGNFVGLIPGKKSSGDSDPAMSITKEGNGHLRKSFVSASKYFGDRRHLYSAKELDKFPTVLKMFLNKCQERLHSRYRHLKSKGKNVNKVRCAVARELGSFIWEYQVKILPQIDREEIFRLAA